MSDLVGWQEVLRLAPLLVLGGLLVVETVRPARPTRLPTGRRWAGNLGLLVVNSTVLVLAGTAFAAVIGFSSAEGGSAQRQPVGSALGMLGVAAASFLILDLTVYALHRAFHALPVLWRFHRIHHSDDQVDATTAVRHHVVEVGAVLLVLQGLSLLLGIPDTVLLAYGAIYGIVQFVQHANVALPPAAERVLGRVTITPRMHAVHHSRSDLAQKNFGTLFNVWDRLFRTLDEATSSSAGAGPFGVEEVDAKTAHQPAWLLLSPFARTRRGEEAPRSDAIGTPRGVH